MPLIDHFGLVAPYYDRMARLRDPEKIIRLAGLPVSGRLLDAGGGTGRVSEALRGLSGKRVIADLSLQMARQASAKTGLLAICAASERLPFPAAVFERVIIVDALHHVVDQHQTAAELWRVLAPGGRILIEEPDVRSFPAKVVAVVEKLLLMRSHLLSPHQIQGLFAYHDAQVRIEGEEFIAWVIVDKKM